MQESAIVTKRSDHNKEVAALNSDHAGFAVASSPGLPRPKLQLWTYM